MREVPTWMEVRREPRPATVTGYLWNEGGYLVDVSEVAMDAVAEGVMVDVEWKATRLGPLPDGVALVPVSAAVKARTGAWVAHANAFVVAS